MTLRFLMGVGVAMLISAGTALNAATIRVDLDSSTNGPGTATNWSNAFDNLDDAIAAANSGDELWVADGVYHPTVRLKSGDPTSVTYLLPEEVLFYGGFQGLSRSGGGETLRAQRNPELYETILSGDLDDDDDVDSNDADTVLTATGSTIDDDTRVNGFTIRDSSDRVVRIEDGAWPVFARCIITGGTGGGIFIDNDSSDVPPSGPARFLSCEISNNSNNIHGAGVFGTSDSAYELVNCLGANNTAGGYASFALGTGSFTAVINCTITGNYTTQLSSGGGAALRFFGAGEHIVSNCIVWGNSNSDGSDEGAQIAPANSVDLTVSYCDIQGLDAYAGNGNFDLDPMFNDAVNDDYRIDYLSELLNSGDEGEVPADTYDIDDDSDTTELVPDRAVNDRQNNPTDCVDVGAYENQVAGTCTADITDDSTGEPDGDVGDPDLDLVYERWGSIGGVADIAPTPCGNGVVDVDDLLAVINNWGSCNSFGPSGLTTQQAIDMLYDRLLTHPEQEEAIMDSIEYLLEFGL